MLCWFLPYIHMSQSQVCMLPLPLEPPCQLPSHPTPLGCHRSLGLSSLPHTANPHWLSVWHMVIVNVNVHTFVNVHMFWCYSLSMSHPFLPLLCLQVCSLCLCLHWKWKCKSLSCVWLSATPWTGLPGSSVHGILQARALEWVAFPFSRASSQPRIKARSPALRSDLYHLSLQGSPPGQSPLLPCKLGHLHHLSRSHIYALI